MRKIRLAVMVLSIVGASAGSAAAQPVRDARLTITVVDQSGAVIPGVTLTVTALEAVAKASTVAPIRTTDRGAATIDALAPGRYAILAEFPGFEPGRLADVRIRRGDNKHVVVLAIKRVEESVSVAQDPQAAAADPRGSAFTAALTPDEIDALSDDPAEMVQQLLDLAGGNAVIKVDSFLGAALPPKAMIKSIHIVRDAFSAENHSAETEEIDIITQPGIGPIRGNISSRFRDGSMSGRSPFTPTKGPERVQNYTGNLGGTLVKNKSSFSLNAGRRRSFDTPILLAAVPGGQTRSEILGLRRPDDGWNVRGLADWAITRNHVIRMAFDSFSTDRSNLGVGAYDLIDRAYATESRTREFRVMEVGPIGRRMFGHTRLQLGWQTNRSRSAVEAPTFRVQDAFTSGGAQVSGGRRVHDFEAASDVDYVRGIHTVRAGVELEGGRFHSDDSQNYLGTYLFTSLAAFDARQAAIYTRRIGNPLIDYFFLRSGVYVQDDLRVRKNLTFSPGIRYEAQTHLKDYGNFGPRFGMTWSPTKSGKTTLRASWGIFYNWLNQNTYEQTLRVDGFRQQEVNIVNPVFPDPGNLGTVFATNKYLLGDDVQMSRTMRVSTGIDRTLSPKLRVSLAFSSVRGANVLRGANLNAPVGGLRPDRAFANIIAIASDAESRNNQLTTSMNVNLTPPGRTASQPLWNWAPIDDAVHLLDRRAGQQHGRRVQRVANRYADHRMGSGARRTAPSHAGVDQQPGAPQSERVAQSGRQYRHAIHHHDGLRRQRRFDLQRSAARYGKEHCQDRVAVDLVGERFLCSAGGCASRDRTTGTGESRGRAGAGSRGIAISNYIQRRDYKSYQSRELHRLQRRHDVAVLRAADCRGQPPKSRHERQLRFLGSNRRVDGRAGFVGTYSY